MVMRPGGVFGQGALSGTVGQALFVQNPNVARKLQLARKIAVARKFGASGCGLADIVPDDFGTDLITPEILAEADQLDEDTQRLIASEESGAPLSAGALGLTGTSIALILGAVGLGVWMLTKPKRVKANKSSKRRLMGTRKKTKRASTLEYLMGKKSDKELGMINDQHPSKLYRSAALEELLLRRELRGRKYVVRATKR